MASHSPQPDAPLIVIAGPTASGKTALALALAQQFSGEIVSCDSVAVYRGMEIGTAKPTLAERARVPHHLIDILTPDQPCTAGDYAASPAKPSPESPSAAACRSSPEAPASICARCSMASSPRPNAHEPLREKLRAARRRRNPPRTCTASSARLDPAAAALIHANDTPKVIRAIEVTLGRAPAHHRSSGSSPATR